VAGHSLAADQPRLVDLALRLFSASDSSASKAGAGHGQHRVDVDAAALGGELDCGRGHLLRERLAVLAARWSSVGELPLRKVEEQGTFWYQ